ncbi:MAG: class I SAM-dependent methyltransferase [Firmicutes bacterium]|nr:class I SAM-dependent methyltransferase [Bacillota bacterium]
MPNINNIVDLYDMLDARFPSASFNWMYADRPRQAPFIAQNELPDENLAEFLETCPMPARALELGCGEGRNAIYMAGRGMEVTAIDLSPVAINHARKLARKRKTNVEFLAKNIFQIDLEHHGYDFVYDSGCFHHLTPHRRLSYLDLLEYALVPGGYFGLTCFAWGENCADEVDDWAFYDGRHVGAAFTEERLRDFFGGMFDMIYIRKCRDGIPGTIQGLEFMWACLFRKKL